MTTQTVTNQDRKPSYIAFKTFLTAVETLEQGLPPVIDRSVWHTFAGGLQGHTLNAFKFLGLVDEKGQVQPILEKLVNAKGEDRKVVIREIITDKYKEAISLGQKNASFQQLQEYFRNYGVQGGTLEMVVRFFLDACKYTGAKGSPLWVKAKKSVRRSRREESSNISDKTPPSQYQSAEQTKPNVQTIQLKSGGTISLSVVVDLISLSSEDRQWLFKMIDQFKEYTKTRDEQK